MKIAGISSTKAGDVNEGELKKRRQYQGAFAKYDEDIQWNDFALRNYDPQIARWVQQDPYQQFASPYVALGGDPVNMVDPSGGWSIAAGLFASWTRLGVVAVTTLAGGILGNAAYGAAGGKGAKGLIVGAFLGLASNFVGGGGGAIGQVALQAVIGGGKILANNAVAMPTVAPPQATISNVGVTVTSNTDVSVAGAMNVSNNGEASPNWGSQLGFYVHQFANQNAMDRKNNNPYAKTYNYAKYNKLIEYMNEGTVWADGAKNQTGERSFMHGMRNEDTKETVEEAKTKADAYVRAVLTEAKKELKLGNIHLAYFLFGAGLHVLQDATSPAHNGFQPWSDNISSSRLLKHVSQELYYPGLNSNLQKISNQYLDWFESNCDDPLPSGNLFDNIKKD